MNAMTEKISIIVPVYKVERSLLCAALDSIRTPVSYTHLWQLFGYHRG